MTVTETTRADRATALKAAEAQAVLMVRNNIDLPRVEAETGLTREQIATAVGRANANRNARETPANVPAPKIDPFAAVTTPKPPRPTVKPTVTVTGADLDSIEELLAWADTAGPQRAQILAARIRSHVDELRGISRRAEQVKDAQTQVDRLTAELSRARAALREANGHKPAATAGAPAMDRERSLRIRAWARENGHQIAERGAIPGHVLSAYAAAHEA